MKEIDGFINKSYESEGIRRYALYYSTKLSYEETSKLCSHLDGDNLLSDQRIQQIVLEKAASLKAEQTKLINKHESKSFPKIDYDLDIYDSSSREIHIFEDGIGVRKQKEKRDKVLTTKKERYYTNLVMLEKRNKSYKHIVACEGIVLDQLLGAEINQEYGRKRKALPIIVFSDGASTIRNRMQSVLGQKITRILDWYHLRKKIWQLMSMIARSKQIKEIKAKEMLHFLWNGKTDQAIKVLENIVAKNTVKKEELLTYLDKHKSEIINYEKRKEAGKTIGSGRVEKGADLIVGIRQKTKPMSWSPVGSNALALVTAHFLNENISKFR